METEIKGEFKLHYENKAVDNVVAIVPITDYNKERVFGVVRFD